MALVLPGDFKNKNDGTYNRTLMYLAGVEHGDWCGYALVNPGANYSSLDVIVPSQQRGKSDTTGLIIPAGSLIRSVGFRTLGNLTLGASSGKLKLATALAAATGTLYVESAAAASNTLAAQATAVETQNVTPVTVGGSDVTYKLFATDGAAGASAAASTVSATKLTKILVRVSFIKFGAFPTEDEVGYAAPAV